MDARAATRQAIVDEGAVLCVRLGAGAPLVEDRHGAQLVKVFPAAALGGPAFLRAVRGPLPDVPLLPTSGPTAETLAGYLDAGAVAVGIGAEVFPPGFDPDVVEAAARRVRAALDAARAFGPEGRREVARDDARVELVPIAIAERTLQGLSCTWADGQYTAVVAPKGLVGCGIFDPDVCERFGFAVAMAHGTPEVPLCVPRDLLGARLDTVSSRARELGIEPGMTGEEALRKLL